MDKNEAIKIIRSNFPTGRKMLCEALEILIPELKESEDEKIRKHLLRHFRNKTKEEWDGMPIKNIISWLEKQKDHEDELEKAYKTADEVQYRKGFEDGVASVKPAEWSEDEKIRKEIIQSIQDNMCVIHKDKCIAWLEKQGEHANFRNKIQIGDEVTRNEDGVLVNLSQFKRMVKQGEQKPAWSKENICYYDDICEILINLINSPKSNVNKDVVQKDLDWLRSVKESQLKPTWSEGDENGFGDALWAIQQARTIAKNENEMGGLWYAEKWLKSLKERMKGE